MGIFFCHGDSEFYPFNHKAFIYEKSKFIRFQNSVHFEMQQNQKYGLYDDYFLNGHDLLCC